MIVLKFILFLIWFMVVPWMIGLNYHSLEEKKNMIIQAKYYMAGLCIELVIFQVYAIVLTFLKGSMMCLTGLWLVTMMPLCLSGLRKYFSKEKNVIIFQKRQKENLTEYNRHRRFSSSKGQEQAEYLFVLVIAVILVVFQVIFVVMHVHDDLDDSWYVGTAVSSYFTDTINLVSPYSGEIGGFFHPDYTLSPWPVFCGMISKLCFTHPAIVMRNFIPVIFIPLSYFIYGMLAYRICEEKRKTVWLMVFLSLFNLYGNWSIRSTSTFLLFRIWQGKAILCNIFIPLLVYFFMDYAESEKKKKKMLQIFFVIGAGTMISSMGVFLAPVMLVALALVDTFLNHRVWNNIQLAICIIPCVLQFGIYLWMRS